ncbi:MAG: aldo/keto reductase [Planctomycetota bacterium]|nr:aldo/keto reductase [Planctomycetota bacterium]
MRYHDLAGLAPAPSRVCLGTSSFGSDTPEAEAFAILDAFAAAGGNFLDTAHIYAAWRPGGAGQSERTIGKWLKRAGLRGKMVVGTKGAHFDMQTKASGVRRETIAQHLAESLERLQLSNVDLYWLHRDDPEVPVGEILGWLNEHLKAGTIRALGCSNWTVARMEEAARHAKRHGLAGFCASQIGWSLARAATSRAGSDMLYADDETRAYHVRSGMPQVGYSTQANGFFSGKYDPGAPPEGQRKGVLQKYGLPENFRRLEAARRIARLRGVTSNQVALASLFAQPFPFFAIVGPKSVEQARDSCAAGDLALTAEETAALA